MPVTAFSEPNKHERKVAVTAEVRRGKETLFFYAMPGTTPNNADWVRRKRNVVEALAEICGAALDTVALKT